MNKWNDERDHLQQPAPSSGDLLASAVMALLFTALYVALAIFS